MSDSPRKTDLLNDTVVGDFANSTDLWDAIEKRVKAWRVACCDEEGKDLLAFLHGKQLDRFLSLAGGLTTPPPQRHPMQTRIVNRFIGNARNMEELVANLALALAQTTGRLEEIKAICNREDLA